MTDDPRPGRFDPALDAWILSRHADVEAALREPRLGVAGERDGAAAASAASPASVVAALRDAAERTADERVATLPGDEPLDLVAAFAAPWSLGLAMAATGADPADAPRLAALARAVFLDAASATGPHASPDAQQAIVALARALAGDRPHAGAHATMHVQAFVALSQTLPCTLAGAWLALVAHPDAARRLREAPALLPAAVEELLRYAGPSRAVFREARAEVTIGAAAIHAGDRVVLRLAAANRDPARFADPDRLDLDRGGAGHLALGRGAHSCWGAPVIRLAVAAATGALLQATRALDADGAPTWIGGDAIRGPATLPVILRRGERR